MVLECGQGNMVFSRAYTFIRSRQLEGTYPGDPREGVWGITSNRVSFGWGRVEEEVWPYFRSEQEYFAPGPSDVDLLAKHNRIHHYQRVRNSSECRRILAHNRKVLSAIAKRRKPTQAHWLEAIAAFEVTQQFLDAPHGMILAPAPDTPILGSHAVPLIADCQSQKSFEFVNSWGEAWGNHGFGYMPYEFFDQWLIEGWALDESRGLTSVSPSIETLCWDVPDPLGERLYGVEIIDSPVDEKVGWAFAVIRDGYLDIEELFVKPAYRGCGHGGQLADRLRDLAKVLGRPLRAWIPYADCNAENEAALKAIMQRLGLSPRKSTTNWAAYEAVPGTMATTEFEPVRLPSRPAFVRQPAALALSPERLLRGSVISYSDPLEPALSPDDWDAAR
jgi:GNAT superfamily N-acetyltransferase